MLRGPSTQARVARIAPEPPADFVARPVEFDALKRRLIDAKGDSVAITAALRGAGGYGKTVLAKALAHDPEIADAYFDGTLWAVLGEKADNLLATVSDLITRLTGTPPQLETLNAAASALGDALGKRRILLVVDDVWREQDLRPFLEGGPNTTRLITTRDDRVLPGKAITQPVDEMRKDEALLLLIIELPAEQVIGLHDEFIALAARLGEWPQLLGIINGFLRRAVKNRQPLAQAVAGVNQRLTDKGLRAFDAAKETDRTRTIAYTIRVSLDPLDAESQARFGELGIFPEDIDVPVGVVARLWNETGGIDSYLVEDLLIELAGLSLLQGLDLDRRTLRLHDNVREEAGDALAAQNGRLVRALQGGGTFEDDAGSRRYYYLHLPWHLHEADDSDALHRLLLDPAWLTEKLAATGSAQALVADYDQHAAREAHHLIGRTLRLTAGICARDPRQLMPQLIGRLMGTQVPEVSTFLGAARGRLTGPTLLPQSRSLTPPGAESARLEGHTYWVSALCVLPDGRLASGSGDNTIRVWDVKTGAESARLEGHTDWVRALRVLPGGRLASGSGDSTIRVWEVKTAGEICRLEVDALVFCLEALPDGRLVAGDQIGGLHWLEIID